MGTLEPLTLVRDRVVFEVVEDGGRRVRTKAVSVGRVRLKPDSSKRLVAIAGERRRRDGDPLAA